MQSIEGWASEIFSENSLKSDIIPGGMEAAVDVCEALRGEEAEKDDAVPRKPRGTGKEDSAQDVGGSEKDFGAVEADATG